MFLRLPFLFPLHPNQPPRQPHFRRFLPKIDGLTDGRTDFEWRHSRCAERTVWMMWMFTERRRWFSITAGQLDDFCQSQTKLFSARTISVLLQRATEHVSASQTATCLRRFHHFSVSFYRRITFFSLTNFWTSHWCAYWISGYCCYIQLWFIYLT